MPFCRSEVRELLYLVDDSYRRTREFKNAFQRIHDRLCEDIREMAETKMIRGGYVDPARLQDYEDTYNSLVVDHFYRKNDLLGKVPEEMLPGDCWDGGGSLSPCDLGVLRDTLPEYQWLGGYFNHERHSVSGNVYRKGNVHYICFDGSTELLDDFILADGIGIFLGFFGPFLNEARGFYEKARGVLKMEKKGLVLLGHSLGGALAETLAAAIYLDAFDGKGRFSLQRCLDASGGCAGENIPTVSYNAPRMGWMFRDRKESLRVVPHPGLGGVDVTAVGMQRDKVFNLWGWLGGCKNDIGTAKMVLTHKDGKLPSYIEEHTRTVSLQDGTAEMTGSFREVSLVFDHFMDTLKLALYSV